MVTTFDNEKNLKSSILNDLDIDDNDDFDNNHSALRIVEAEPTETPK